jgi:uroporphyrinogen decarboxylase
MMTPKERMLSALRRETPDRIPTLEWFLDTSVIRALCGTEDPIEAVERLDIDGINIRADYRKTWKDETVFTDEWDIEKKLTGDMIPACLRHPIPDIADHTKYVFPDPFSPERFKTLERAFEKYGDRRAVILNLRDGFSDMRDLLGYENALMSLVAEKRHFTDLLRRVVEYNIQLAEIAVKRYGIQIVATTDDICSARGPLFSPKVYAEVIYPAFCEVIRGFRSLGLMVIKHCDGDVRPFIDRWIDAGIHCLDPIDPHGNLDMKEIKDKYGDRICLKGNIDCTGCLVSGTPEDVTEEVRLCIEKGGKNGLILSSSNTIHAGVKPENYRAMLNALRCYGQCQ